MNKRRDDNSGTRLSNLFGLVAVLLLVAMSVLVLLRLQHFIARRDCYVQHIHACGSISSGRYTHF